MSLIIKILKLTFKGVKIVWLVLGALMLFWLVYFAYQIHFIDDPWAALLAIFILMFGIAAFLIYLAMTIAIKIIHYFTIKIWKRKRT